MSKTPTYKNSLKPLARNLRGRMTDAELLLWSRIRRKQIDAVQFHRQKPIGRYIVDFYAPAAKLILELDGGQHYDDSARQRDEVRDAYLHARGFQVLRFTNLDVLLEIDAVLERIQVAIAERRKIPPLAPPLRKGENSIYAC